MSARTKSKVTLKYETKHRVKNRAAYEAGRRRRGDVTLWCDEDANDPKTQGRAVVLVVSVATLTSLS